MKRRIFRIGLYVLAGLLVLCLVLFMFRKPLIALVAEHYLAGQGASASVQILRLSSEGISLKVTLGPGEAPDASAQGIDAVFGPGRYGRRVEAVTLTGAFMHIRFDGKRITYGSLTDFIERMLNTSSGDNDFVAPNLPITLKSLRVRVTTQGGSFDLIGEGAIRGSKIEHLVLHGTGGRIGLYGYGYSYRANMRDLALNIASGVKGLNIKGRLDAGVQGNVEIASLKLSFAADGVTTGSRIALPHLRLAADMKLDEKQAEKFASSVPYWSGDADNHAVLKKALGDFHIDAPDLSLFFVGKQTKVVLNKPVAVTSVSKVRIDIDGAAETATAGGRANIALVLSGGGLAPTQVSTPNLVWRNNGSHMEGGADLSARFTAQMLRDANVSGRFGFALVNTALRVDIDDCTSVMMAGLRSGRSLVATKVSGKVCALSGQPIYALDTKGWHARARWVNGIAHIVAANAQLSASSGEALIDGEGDPKTGIVTIRSAQLGDGARSKRFGALRASGKLTLASGVWRGDIAVSNAARRAKIGNVTFTHVLATGAGEAQIDARDIVFKQKGLQPVDLSPLLVNVARMDGKAHFIGTVGWRQGSKISSKGMLTVEDSSFATPLGTAHGGKVKINFTSLVPLVAAPGQQAEIAKIDWVSSLTKSFAQFGFTQEKLTLQTAGTNAAKGSVRLDPLVIYFASGKGVSGRLAIDNVDLGQLLADSNLGEDVKIEAKITGAIPFHADAKGFRITDGKIAATGPGRLSIKRSLWMGSRTTEPNAMEDFAYQALENLAFDKLEGTLNSLPNGRMRLVFHIIGQNDPAKAREATIDVIDLIKGEAFQKPMPLPKGTPIDLTLDTNLNFDEVLRAYKDAWADTRAEQRER